MPRSDLDARAEAAKHIAHLAGQKALSFFRSPELVRQEKAVQDFVSEADLAVESLIRSLVNRHFPDDAIIGEELADRPGDSGFTWVIDPIDGTTCFVDGIASWVVSIAIISDSKVAAAVVFDPSAKELFSAQRGAGAFLNDTALPRLAARQLRASTIGIGHSAGSDPEKFAGFLGRLLTADANFLRNGSAASMLAWVAAGRLGGYFQTFLQPWDCLAGLLLIEEAGGKIFSPPMSEVICHGGPVLATAPGLCDALLATGPDLGDSESRH